MFVRGVPRARWGKAAALAVVLTAIALGAWEWRMRSLGLRVADIDDGNSYWAVERRKVEAGPRDPVVIIGDSRILFGSDLDLWQHYTGIRPIQLALVGTSARPFLHELAHDQHFAGMVVLGMSETVYFSDRAGVFTQALEYRHNESPSQRVGHSIQLQLSRVFAFLDVRRSLFGLLDQLPLRNREGYVSRGANPFKLSESFADRQTVMWARMEADPEYRERARAFWARRLEGRLRQANGKAYSLKLIAEVIASTKADIETIRRRGGEVVLIRAPSTGPFLASEHILVPRDKVWDPLVRATSAVAVYFEDYPEMQGLSLPEWSHVSAADQKRFTTAYVSVLCDKAAWLKRHGATCLRSGQ